MQTVLKEKTCRKCQTLFSGKKREKYPICHVEFTISLQRVFIHVLQVATKLIFISLWVNSADDKLTIFYFLFFAENML